ncbi:MAG: redoxin domain-containing protein [Anaerolineae bacterium]|nr:redoxin domain-containing protein [Anaerolineae bacterium]
MAKHFRFFGLALLISLLGVVLAACGSDEEAADNGGTNATPTAEQGLQVGDAAPAFTLPATDGSQVSLADYVGQRPVLLYFHMAVG